MFQHSLSSFPCHRDASRGAHPGCGRDASRSACNACATLRGPGHVLQRSLSYIISLPASAVTALPLCAAPNRLINRVREGPGIAGGGGMCRRSSAAPAAALPWPGQRGTSGGAARRVPSLQAGGHLSLSVPVPSSLPSPQGFPSWWRGGRLPLRGPGRAGEARAPRSPVPLCGGGGGDGDWPRLPSAASSRSSGKLSRAMAPGQPTRPAAGRPAE